MDYTLRRSNRKTLAIHITREATVEVRAPLRLSQQRIDAFVQEKTPWIEAHLAWMTPPEPILVDYGQSTLFRGRLYPIVPRPGKSMGFDGTVFYLPEGLDSAAIHSQLETIYKQLAKTDFPRRVAYFAPLMGVKPQAVKVNSAQTRWGSCSGQGNLNFSWRLVLAEEALINYVVVHELAHLKQMNHSPLFWQEVEAILPDYRQLRQNLKPFQTQLTAYQW